MPLSASVFRRGGPKKELFEVLNEEADDAAELDDKLRELEELLQTDKAGKDLSAAIWRPHVCAAEVVKQRKQTTNMGFMRGGRTYLHVEEAVFLLDRGDLLLFAEVDAAEEAGGRDGGCVQRLMSVQEAFDLMLSLGVGMDTYLLYSSLCRSGYHVMRHPSRWGLERGEQPEQVWGAGAWAACYGRRPSVPGSQPQPPMQHQLQPPLPPSAAPAAAGGAAAGEAAAPAAGDMASSCAAGGGGAGGTGPAAQPMEVDGGAGTLGGAARCGAGGPGGAVAGPGPGSASGNGAAGATAGGAGSGSGGAGVSRRWYPCAGPGHPYLHTVPDSWFQEQQPAVVDERLAVQLAQRFPLLRPFPHIRSAAHPPPPGAAPQNQAPAAAAAPHGAAPPATPASAAATAAASTAPPPASSAAAPPPAAPTRPPYASVPALGQPRVNAHLLFDVYKPGAIVSRSKRQWPPCLTHLAMCSPSPPALCELHAADAQAAAACAGERGLPDRVTWVAVLNGDVAMYSMGPADLLKLI